MNLSHIPTRTARCLLTLAGTASLLALLTTLSARGQGEFPPPGQPPFAPGSPFPGGRGGPGGPMQSEVQLLKQFDLDKNEWLDRDERRAAREYLAKRQADNPGPWGGGRRGDRRGGPGFPFGRENQDPPQPGLRITPAEVPPAPDVPLYDPWTLRTLFLDFENQDWEKELSDFHNTDVGVPARLTVDGQVLEQVGVHFRGASSYMMVQEGYKRSLNLSLDFVSKDQNLRGYRTLNLLNSHEDPSCLRAVLALEIARDYLPAPKANLVRVVINGENWGVYASVQQFNKDFIQEHFGTAKGDRWKTPGSPNGRAGLNDLGDDPEAYKQIYEIKSKDKLEAWQALIQLCQTLNNTPPEQLEQALHPILDIDATLRFLAWEIVVANYDGYWTRASDYSLYRDPDGRFHIIPYDANETFTSGGPGFGFGGPGMRRGRGVDRIPGDPEGFGSPPGAGSNPGPRGFGPGGPGGAGGGSQLDPLVGLNDDTKPLRSRLLAVPSLKARYLTYVREMASKWLDWERLGPLATRYHQLIDAEVKADTRKLDDYEAFAASLTTSNTSPSVEFRGPAPKPSLKSFADQRRAFLLSYQPAQ